MPVNSKGDYPNDLNDLFGDMKLADDLNKAEVADKESEKAQGIAQKAFQSGGEELAKLEKAGLPKESAPKPQLSSHISSLKAWGKAFLGSTSRILENFSQSRLVIGINEFSKKIVNRIQKSFGEETDPEALARHRFQVANENLKYAWTKVKSLEETLGFLGNHDGVSSNFPIDLQERDSLVAYLASIKKLYRKVHDIKLPTLTLSI